MIGKDNFHPPLLVVPESVVIAVGRPVNTITMMFQYSVEYLLEQIIEALSDKTLISKNLYFLGKRLNPIISEVPDYEHHGLIDRMVAIEQCALDIGDYLELYRLYLYDRYLPYNFETLMSDGSILLKRVDNYERFCERIITKLGLNEND